MSPDVSGRHRGPAGDVTGAAAVVAGRTGLSHCSGQGPSQRPGSVGQLWPSAAAAGDRLCPVTEWVMVRQSDSDTSLQNSRAISDVRLFSVRELRELAYGVRFFSVQRTRIQKWNILDCPAV